LIWDKIHTPKPRRIFKFDSMCHIYNALICVWYFLATLSFKIVGIFFRERCLGIFSFISLKMEKKKKFKVNLNRVAKRFSSYHKPTIVSTTLSIFGVKIAKLILKLIIVTEVMIVCYQLPYCIMTSPSKHLSKCYCLTQGIMVVWRGQNNANSPKIVLKPV